MLTGLVHTANAESDSHPSEALQEVIDRLFEKDQILVSDLDALNLNSDEKAYLKSFINEKLNSLRGLAFDKFYEKTEHILSLSIRNNPWESNHSKITNVIDFYMRETGQMPTKLLIAQQTGLSRPTIDKHLKEYQTHPAHQDQTEVSKMMIPNIMASVYKMAVTGDVRAARLYLEMMGVLKQPTTTIQKNTVIEQQNNFVQINETTISQQALQALPPDKLLQIEEIIRQVLPDKRTAKLESGQ